MKTATGKSIEEATSTASSGPELAPRHVFAAFAALFVVNLLLRAFYLRYDFVSGDETIRALTATEFLDGARLYVDIVTDKPPATTLVYAAVFALFGRNMTAVHLAAAVWNFCTAIILYLTAARSYGKRTGLWAALLFVYFSTNYLTQDMMAANTELLMALPYTASFALYVRALRQTQPSRSLFASLFVAGLLAGLAITFKQLGLFNLIFFGIAELLQIIMRRRMDRQRQPLSSLLIRASQRLLMICLGVAVIFAALIGWLQSMTALADFWRHVFLMNTYYIASMPAGLWLRFFVGRTFGYVLFNFTLWSLAAWVAWRTGVSFFHRRQDGATTNGKSWSAREMDLIVTLWAIASLAAVFAGGRFFGHYFIQILPALSLLAARGVARLQGMWQETAVRRSVKIAVSILLLCFLTGLVRVHQRTAILAYETLTGARTAASQRWGMTRREEEAEIITQKLQGRIAAGEALYIWGYALDVYWRIGARPAARYITPNHVTGIFTDAETREATQEEEQFWAESRRYLLDDLRRHNPQLILDVAGDLLSLPYADLVDFVRSNYQREDELGVDPTRPFVVYRRREK